MKKAIVLTLTVMLLSATALFAQNPQRQKDGNEHPRATAEMRAERLAKELELTEQQKAEVLALYKKQEAEYAKKQQDAQKDREAQRVAFQAERKAQDAELKKIIGEEKFQQLQEKRTQQREKMKNSPRPKTSPN